MSEELQTAWDLLHQIQCLPREHRDSYEVDGYETDMSVLQRTTRLVEHIQRLEINNHKLKELV